MLKAKLSPQALPELTPLIISISLMTIAKETIPVYSEVYPASVVKPLPSHRRHLLILNTLYSRKNFHGAGGMAQRLRVLATLPEDPSWDASKHPGGLL